MLIPIEKRECWLKKKRKKKGNNINIIHFPLFFKWSDASESCMTLQIIISPHTRTTEPNPYPTTPPPTATRCHFIRWHDCPRTASTPINITKTPLDYSNIPNAKPKPLFKSIYWARTPSFSSGVHYFSPFAHHTQKARQYQ